jgi:hypothetical protein
MLAPKKMIFLTEAKGKQLQVIDMNIVKEYRAKTNLDDDSLRLKHELNNFLSKMKS